MANGDIVTNQALANRALPSPVSDNSNGAMRMSRRGELVTMPLDRKTLSMEGTYFTCHNPTIDVATTLIGHAAPVLADADATMTKPLIHMINSAASGSLVWCVLDYIDITCCVAGASGTSSGWAAQLDTGATRYSSGTVITFENCNPNMQSSATPVLVTKGGPFVCTAESANVRRLGMGMFKQTIEIAEDRYIFTFGEKPIAGSLVASAKNVYQVNLAPVVLGPTDQLLLALFQVAQNAAGVYKVQCGWHER